MYQTNQLCMILYAWSLHIISNEQDLIDYEYCARSEEEAHRILSGLLGMQSYMVVQASPAS